MSRCLATLLPPPDRHTSRMTIVRIYQASCDSIGYALEWVFLRLFEHLMESFLWLWLRCRLIAHGMFGMCFRWWCSSWLQPWSDIISSIFPQSITMDDFFLGMWAPLDTIEEVINLLCDEIRTFPWTTELGRYSLLSFRGVEPHCFSTGKLGLITSCVIVLLHPIACQLDICLCKLVDHFKMVLKVVDIFLWRG